MANNTATKSSPTWSTECICRYGEPRNILYECCLTDCSEANPEYCPIAICPAPCICRDCDAPNPIAYYSVSISATVYDPDTETYYQCGGTAVMWGPQSGGCQWIPYEPAFCNGEYTMEPGVECANFDWLTFPYDIGSCHFERVPHYDCPPGVYDLSWVGGEYTSCPAHATIY